MQQLSNGGVELREIFAILRKRYLIIAVITLTILAITAIMSFFVLSPVYETRTVILVTQAAPVEYYRYESKEGLEGIMSSISKLPEMTMDTYVGQLKSVAVLEGVIDKLELDKKGYTVGSLAAEIEADVVEDTNLINLRVANTDPALAAKITNTIASEYLDFMSVANERQMEKAIKFLEQQEISIGEELKKARNDLNKLEATGKATSEELSAAEKEVEHFEDLHVLIRSKIDEMKIGKSMNFSEVNLRIVSPAIVPDTPIKPKTSLNMLMALVIGLMFSTGLAFFVNYLDNTVKTPEQVEELFSLPVLGQIPIFRQEKLRIRGVDHGK